MNCEWQRVIELTFVTLFSPPLLTSWRWTRKPSLFQLFSSHSVPLTVYQTSGRSFFIVVASSPKSLSLSPRSADVLSQEERVKERKKLGHKVLRQTSCMLCHSSSFFSVPFSLSPVNLIIICDRHTAQHTRVRREEKRRRAFDQMTKGDSFSLSRVFLSLIPMSSRLIRINSCGKVWRKRQRRESRTTIPKFQLAWIREKSERDRAEAGDKRSKWK